MNKLLPILMAGAALTIAFAFFHLPIASSGSNGPQLTSTNYQLNWNAIGEISGGTGSSAHYALRATIGQTGANSASTSTNYAECTGWECLVSFSWVHLPLIVR